MIPLELYGRMLSTVTGIKEFADEGVLLKLGERIWNLERMFNVREGFGRKDDILPVRFLKETLKEGNRAHHTVDLEAMLDDYYSVRGWDVETGIPTEEKLKELENNGFLYYFETKAP